jgi:hypothetical protein
MPACIGLALEHPLWLVQTETLADLAADVNEFLSVEVMLGVWAAIPLIAIKRARKNVLQASRLSDFHVRQPANGKTAALLERIVRGMNATWHEFLRFLFRRFCLRSLSALSPTGS